MKRKTFIKSAIGASVLSAISPSLAFNDDKTEHHKNIVKPGRLKSGDTVGLIAPAGFIKEEERDESIKNLQSIGFKVECGKHLLDKHGYLAGKDENRADDVNQMFADKKIDGIVCARGGYGCNRILPLLDYKIIKENPKVLVGYSDITSLVCGIYSKTGLIGFHGPVGISTFNDYSVKIFNNVLINPKNKYCFPEPEDTSDKPELKLFSVTKGKAKGRLIGGNLSVIASLIGTEYDVDTTDKIIFLEDVSEEPYRIDRMLTQMILAGKFKKAAGVALGVFSKCEPKPDQSGITNSFNMLEVIADRLSGLNIPVVYGFSFGHIVNKFTIPCGVLAELDANNKKLTLLESAVK